MAGREGSVVVVVKHRSQVISREIIGLYAVDLV